MNYVQEISDESQFEEHTIDVITHQVGAVEEKKCPKQLFTPVKVNNPKDVTFQLDCGATCNLLSLKKASNNYHQLVVTTSNYQQLLVTTSNY